MVTSRLRLSPVDVIRVGGQPSVRVCLLLAELEQQRTLVSSQAKTLQIQPCKKHSQVAQMTADTDVALGQ